MLHASDSAPHKKERAGARAGRRGRPAGKLRAIPRHKPSDTKAQLVAAAIKLFGHNGFHATSVGDIVDAAGTSKGAFYHHFYSKDEVLRQIHDQFIDSLGGRVREVVARELSAEDTIRLIMEEFARCSEEFREEITIFFRERQYLTGKVFAEIRRKRSEIERLTIDTLERGIANGEFHPLQSTRIVAFGIIGMGAWMYQWYRSGGALDYKTVARIYSDVVVDGLRSRSGSKGTSRA